MSKEGGYLNTELHFGNIECTRNIELMLTLEMQIAELRIKVYHSSVANLYLEEPYAGKPLVRVCGGAGR